MASSLGRTAALVASLAWYGLLSAGQAWAQSAPGAGGLRIAGLTTGGTASGLRPTSLALDSATSATAIDSGSPAADRWHPAIPTEPDLAGARRDALYFIGYQIVGVGVLYIMPESITKWSAEDKAAFGFEQWWENVTHPVWDQDDFFMNYVLHPYWGGTYYIRARERGLDRMQSFWFSALMSALWEFGAEAIAERPSIQDLIFTPALGALVGEYLFTPLRQSIRAKSGPLDWTDRTLLALTDPFGAINDTINQWFGVTSSVHLAPTTRRLPGSARDTSAMGLSGPQGKRTDGWNLQVRVEW